MVRPYVRVSPAVLAATNAARPKAQQRGLAALLGIAAEQAFPFAARRLAEAGAR